MAGIGSSNSWAPAANQLFTARRTVTNRASLQSNVFVQSWLEISLVSLNLKRVSAVNCNTIASARSTIRNVTIPCLMS